LRRRLYEVWQQSRLHSTATRAIFAVFGGADDRLQVITYPIIPTGSAGAPQGSYGKQNMKDKVAPVSDTGSSGPGWLNSKARAVLFAREGAKVLKLTSTAMWPRDQADY